MSCGKGMAALDAYRKSGKVAKKYKRIGKVSFPFGDVFIKDGHSPSKSYFCVEEGKKLVYHPYSKKSGGYKSVVLFSDGKETKRFTKSRLAKVLRKGAVFA